MTNSLQTADTFEKFTATDESPTEIGLLRNDFRWANDTLRKHGTRIHLQWVYAQGRPCSTYRYHVVFHYGDAGHAQSKLTHATFDEVVAYFKGLTAALEIR